MAKQTYGPITVDVPKGWTVEETEEMLTFTAPDDSAAFSIIVSDEAKGANAKEFAEKMSKELNGDKPQKEDGGYSFDFKDDKGNDCSALVMDMENDHYMIWLIRGEHPELLDLVNSLNWND
jgi:hypothetical protein